MINVNKYNFRFIFTLVIPLLVFTSCEKIIEANLDDSERRIVVNSIFSADSILDVNITKSLHVLDNQDVKYIDDANVDLYENDEFVGTLENYQNGNYILNDFYPVVNKTYKLKVLAEGLKSVEAENSVPLKANIISIDTATVYSEYNKQVECKIQIQDPAGEENFYLLSVYAYGEKWDDYSYEPNYELGPIWFETNDPVVEEEMDGEGVLFSDILFDGSTYTITINIDYWSIAPYYYDTAMNDTSVAYFYLNSISKEYYNYAKSFEQYRDAANDPFAEPVRVYSNITNGLGIFAGYSSKVVAMSFVGYLDDFGYYEDY